MVQQTIDTKYSESGLGNTEAELPTRGFAIKKTVLIDLQNNHRIEVPSSIGDSDLLKDRGPVTNKLSGTKRTSPEEDPNSPSQHQSPNNNTANGHLVYVRRKSEAELGKGSTCDSKSINTHCLPSRQLIQQSETINPISQIKESKVSCFPAFASFPMASSIIPSGKPSVPLPLGKSSTRLASAESNHHSIFSATPSLGNSKELRKLPWDERYNQLQSLLRKLDQSEQEDYIQMLRSLSSVELSRHAVDLEKRSIQLSLEEAKELERVRVLNVLGKSMKNDQTPSSTPQDRPEK
ncbi:hypothetical protein UlMin_032098 [Ulmus minor]